MEAAIRSVQVGQRADAASSQPPTSISYPQRIPSGASPIHRPVDTPQPYSKGPQPTPAASPQSYRVPAREAPIRYVQQNPYGTMQPFREAPYVRVPQVPQQVEYRSAPISVPANISISHGLPPTSTIETVANNASNRPRISLLPEDRRIQSEYLSNRPQQATAPDPGGPPAFKKIRLTENHSQSPPPLLKVDVREPPTTGAYHPQVEAISPTPPNDPSEELRATKDELLQKITKVDMEINKAEKTIAMLKSKQASLEEVASKPAKAEEKQEVQPKHRSLAQKIYAENRKKANSAHEALSLLGPPVEMPLYNQPSDVEICKEIIQRHQSFKSRLLLHLKKLKSERAARNQALAEKYSLLSQEWLRRVEKIESSAKRKAKEAKNKEFFEKVFTELRKQREDKERFNRVGSRIKSEADVEEIIDGLQEQANEDKKMRSYAVIPPLMLDAKQKRYVFHNENGSLTDMENDLKDRKNLNVWTTGEKEIFKEKFLQHPKNFGAIAASLDRKSAQDCVRYYYLSKKTENYKQLLRKSRQRTRSSRNPNKSIHTQSQCIVDAMTTGVTTRLQREQQQKTGARATNSANITPPRTTTGSTTPPNSLPTQFTSQVRCSQAESTPTSTTTIDSTNNAADTTTTASTTTNNVNESEIMSVSTKAGDSDSSVKSTNVDKDKNDESFREKTDGTAANPTNSDSPNALPTDGTVTSANNSGNQPQTTNSTPTTSSATNTNCTSIVNTVNGLKTDIVTSLANKTTAMSVAPSKENASHSNNVNQPSSATVTVTATATAAAATTNASSTPTENDTAKLDNNKKAVDTSVSSAVNTVASNANEEDEKLEESEAKKRRKETSESTEDDATTDSKDKLHPCFVCKQENCVRTRPLEKGRGQQYGISDDTIPAGARVCNTCQCKSVRNRYPSCPLPTCPNPKDRVTRFRNLPARLFELAADIREPIIQEFQIPANVTKCCSACLIKIKRKLGPNLLGTNLTDEEITKLKTLLHDVGPKWSQLAESLGKTAVALRSFCFHYKKKYSFDLAVNEYYKSHPSEERRTAITDGDESNLSTSSCDENEGGSDTASVDSPKATSNNQTLSSSSSTSSTSSSSSSSSNVIVKKEESTFEPANLAANTDDRLLPPAAQPPRKQKAEEYDSSATETADEENEASPGNRNSPKVLLYQNQTTITMVPSTVQNGPRDSINREMTNVRDVMLDVIERSLKTGQQPPPPKPSIAKSNVLDPRADITFDIHYRNDIGKPHHISSMANVTQPAALPRSSNQEGLATLSVVNSHGHPQQVLSHPHSISSQIAATITPVQNQTSSLSSSSLSSSSSSNQNQSSSVPKTTVHDVQKDSVVVYPRAEEPQTLDLSIKKPVRDNFPPPAHSKPIPGNSVTMYRSDPHAHAQTPPSIVNTNPNYMMYDQHRPSKSPSIFMPNVPTSMPMSQQPQHSIQNLRVHQNPSMHSQVSQQPSISSQSKVKTAPKLSPKVTQHQSNNQQQGGHKGSITHGTVNSNNQQILIQSPATLSPRFDGILRQTPPSGDKLGSITQGTPVHLPPHHLTDKARVYDYYKNRQSPAQPPQQPSPQAATFGSPYAQGRPPGPYAIEQQAQLSSRQIIMNDFITSQQMHGQQVRGRSEKESPSPRSTGVPGSPAQLYYAEKEQQRQRAEYLSRASPAEHINSTPSPHRTPPPQRQGVIQRHNTGGSKPPSPAPNRLHIMSQHHYAMPGHEAFSSLVDVAVQQPLLPVPHKEEKRPNVPVSEPQQHHEIRYHPHLAAAHEQMAMMHQQQQQIRVEMQRRHMQQQERERVDRERERERERVDRERHHQDRLDRERRDEQFRQRGDRWKSPERERAERDRERERIVMEEQELERRRMANAVAHPFIRDGQNIPRDNRPGRQADGSLTAASLIDAIITHQINQNASEPPVMRDGHRQPFFPGRDLHPENNGKPHSLNVINIDSDSDRRNPILTKSITLGELTDSIIAKDYSPNPFLPLRQTAFMQYRPDQAEIWKMNRRLTQKDGIPVPQSQPPQQLPPPASHNQNKSSSNSKVSMHEINSGARSASPRTTKAYHESITPPENYHYAVASAHSRIPSQQSSGHQFALDCYVKNRIVEAMRTEESDKRGDEIPEQQRRTPQERPTPSSSVHHSKEHDRSSTPGEMVIDEESSQARPASGTAERKESWPSFTPTTYAYPFSALNVSGAASNLPPQMKTAHVESDSGARSQPQAQEPKPLLSAQYEALSDED